MTTRDTRPLHRLARIDHLEPSGTTRHDDEPHRVLGASSHDLRTRLQRLGYVVVGDDPDDAA